MDDHKKKIIVLCMSSIMLVAMVIAIIYIEAESEEHQESDDVLASRKAISTICDTTDYKKTCVDSLNSAGTNSSDPRELIQVVFQVVIKYIHEAANNSIVIQKLEKDPRAKSALVMCNELAESAVRDLERSLTKFKSFDIIDVDDILMDLKIWISGAITRQETCLDGFQDVPGDAGQRMRDALETSMQMSSNVLAMVEELSTYLQAMGVESFTKRRLLSVGHGRHRDVFPEWIDFNARKLLTSSTRLIRPNLIVAKDGSGKCTTINEALKDLPKKRNGVFVLYIKQGIYEENVKIDNSMTNLLIIGDGPTKTRITGKLNFIDGIGTYHTATVAVHGDGFIARNIGFENIAGPEKHQAVALRVSADKAIFHNCHMDGYQDTLYTHAYRQFYRSCVISGTIDFIFGDGAVVFQGCTMLIRKPLDNQQCIVTAQGRKDVHQPTGLVLQNCTVKAADDYYAVKDKIKSYLGRPWKEYSRTIVMESFLDDLIQSEGWLPWNETFAMKTLFYTEFNNRGPAAHKIGRVKWPGVKELPPDRVKRFTAAEFLDGNRWIPSRKVPYTAGFIFPVPKEDPNVKYSPVVPEETKDLGAEPIISSPKNDPAGSAPASAPAAPHISSPVSVPETLIIASPVASPIGSADLIAPLDTGPAALPITYPLHTISPVPGPEAIIVTSPVASPTGSPAPSTGPAAAPLAPGPAPYTSGPASAPEAIIVASPTGSPAPAPVTNPSVESAIPPNSPMTPPSVSPGASPQSSNGESYAHIAAPPSLIGNINPNDHPFSSFGSFIDNPPLLSALPPMPRGSSVSNHPHHQSDVTAAAPPPLSSFLFGDALT